MGYRVNFLDNEKVNAADLNAVAAEMGGTASAFKDGVLYGVDALNGISKNLIYKGVSRGCDLVVLQLVEDAESHIKIGQGVLFMSDGKRVEIDAEGIVLPFMAGTAYYVWFSHDIISGLVTPCCTTEAPKGDYVLLGRITVDGEVIVTPEMAVMKNGFLGRNKTETFTFSLEGGGSAEEKLLYEFKPAQTGYNRVILYSPGQNGWQTFCGMVEIETKEAFSVMCRYTYDSGWSSGYSGFSLTNNEGCILAGIESSNTDNNWHYLYLRPALEADGVLRIYRKLVRTTIGGTSYVRTRSVTAILC
ncbi:MAG: hypothetical protein IKW06_02210 [Clostridia bacterium]|nr:hypothetical protein [Clostridia bacterium]